jgi:ribonuclease HI
MADFIAEWTKVPIQEEEPHSSLPRKEDPESWVMYFDGAFSIEGAGAGVLLVSPTGDELKYMIQLAFSHEDSTNNTAEYEGLIAGLRITAGLGISRLVVRGDSQLVVNQVNKAYDCPQMWAYIDEVRKLEHHFDGLKLEHIPREKNAIADELSQIAAKRLPIPVRTFIEWLAKPSMTSKEAVRTPATSSPGLSRQPLPAKARP